jgi:hypothetical protein
VRRATWLWGAALVALATGLRVAWVLAVPTVPVSDFAMYRESANYLSEFGSLDPGFIYMPGFVALLAWVKNLGGDLLAQKLIGVAFGGVGAAGLFVVSVRLLDDAEPPGAAATSCRWRRLCPCPRAATATLIYALWPAGVAMSSVVGTDVPAAALLALALALLVGLAPERPVLAAIAFGVGMGLAAWVRAVALPLSALALGYWLARRTKPLRALLLTAIGVAATLVVLLPWGIRHVRHSGQLYFTDDHGGITALIGANPNSEGTYTRALNRMFKDVAGRSVLDEPHRETDRAAFAIAREWFAFEPRYALGLAVMKADRLFDPEHRLLYWSLLRPGVLVGPRAQWLAAHRAGITGAADWFGFAVIGLALAGMAAAVARRRWPLLALVPFMLALVATYTLFFAEPRYRLPIEILAFPFVALALAEIAAAVAAGVRRSRAGAVHAARALVPALVLVVVWRFAWPAVIDWGAGLRARHRWAICEAELDGHKRLLLWARQSPVAGRSPLAGAPEGVSVRDGGAAPIALRLRLGGGPLPPGRYAIEFPLEAGAGEAIHAELAGGRATLAAPARSTLTAEVAHAGGRFELTGSVSVPDGGSLWLAAPRIVTKP